MSFWKSTPTSIPDPTASFAAAGDRAMAAICNAERMHRQSLQQELAQAHRLLLETVLFIAPALIDEHQRQNPHWLEQLDTQGWAEVLQEARNRVRGRWSAAAQESIQAEVERLRAANERLEQQLARNSLLQSAFGRENRDASTKSHAVPDLAPPHGRLVKLPAVPAQPPAEFAAQISPESWTRSAQFLSLLGLTGWSLQEELIPILAGKLGISAKAGSMGRLLRRLDANGFITRQVVAVFAGKIALISLTVNGRRLVQQMHLPAVEGEWERLLRLEYEDEHAALICLFTAEARKRGYATQVAPGADDSEKEGADILVVDQEGAHTYALLESDSEQPRLNLWQALAVRYGDVAVCATTEEDRQALVAAAFANRLPGRATDINSLRRYLQDALWAEQWLAPDDVAP